MEKDFGFIETVSVSGAAKNVRVILPRELPNGVEGFQIKNDSSEPISVEAGTDHHLLIVGAEAEFETLSAEPEVPHIVNRAMAEASVRAAWKRIS